MIESKSILVVEDEGIVARDLKFTLQDLGYTVPGIANSGELAIQKVLEYRPDLVLMDIHLVGEMDGIAAAQIISRIHGIPVIYLTAHSDEATLNRAKNTYPLGYIVKPFFRNDLRITIEIALHKHSIDKQLKDNADWISTVLNSIGDGVMATDVEGKITLLNPVAENLTNWSSSEAMGLNSSQVFRIINEHTRKSIDGLIQEVLESQKINLLPENTLLIRKDGTELPIEDSISPILSSRGVHSDTTVDTTIGTVIIFRDSSQKKESAKKLYRQAFFDILTNLPNRVWFRERLIDALERIKRQSDYSFAVLLLDLDHFKSVNDGMGHSVGDLLLAAVAQRLISACRNIDTIARLGGDEFIILLENMHGEAEAQNITLRIQHELSIPFNFNGQEVFTTASMGLVLSSPDYEMIEDLIRDADIAMYRAKANGRGSIQFFDKTMRQVIVQSSQLENYLRRVLERNELEIYYQPIYCFLTRKFVGFEALVRWQHPIRGLVFPDEFLPIADNIGMGINIDKWVLETACAQIMEWQLKHPNLLKLIINVNISGRHFLKVNSLNWVFETVSELGIDPNQINLEITENVLIENTDFAISSLRRLKAMGISFAIDDFGTGYSSLSYLQRFPIDTIKIDRSFVNDMVEENRDSLEIVRAIIMLGKALNIKIVAEGIETAQQFALLQELNCEFGQGYYFSHPMSTHEIESFFEVEAAKFES